MVLWNSWDNFTLRICCWLDFSKHLQRLLDFDASGHTSVCIFKESKTCSSSLDMWRVTRFFQILLWCIRALKNLADMVMKRRPEFNKTCQDFSFQLTLKIIDDICQDSTVFRRGYCCHQFCGSFFFFKVLVKLSTNQEKCFSQLRFYVW